MNDDDVMDVLVAVAPRYSASDGPLLAARADVDRAVAGLARRSRGHGHGHGYGRGRWLSVAAAVVAATTAVVLWPSGGEQAHAAWTAVPEVASARDVALTQAACDRGLADSVAEMLAEERKFHVQLPNVPGAASELAGRSPVVAERRGDFTLVVSSNGGWLVGCLAEPGVSDELTEAAVVDLSRYPARVEDDRVDMLSSFGVGTPTGEAAGVYGRAGSAVSGVEVVAPDGTRVEATVSAGYWTAWWPTLPGARVGATAVVATMADGSTRGLGTLDDLTPPVHPGS